MNYREIYKYEQYKKCSRSTTRNLESRTERTRRKGNEWSTANIRFCNALWLATGSPPWSKFWNLDMHVQRLSEATQQVRKMWPSSMHRQTHVYQKVCRVLKSCKQVDWVKPAQKYKSLEMVKCFQFYYYSKWLYGSWSTRRNLRWKR